MGYIETCSLVIYSIGKHDTKINTLASCLVMILQMNEVVTGVFGIRREREREREAKRIGVLATVIKPDMWSDI